MNWSTFLFVILFNLVKTTQSWAKREVSVDLRPEKPLVKCEKEFLARKSCQKEVAELCSALSIQGIEKGREVALTSLFSQATGDVCKVMEKNYIGAQFWNLQHQDGSS